MRTNLRMPDVDALRKLRAAGIAALLYGPPGTGKTSLVEAAFGEEVITVAGDGDTTTGDLAGDYTQRDDGSYEFVYGPLITAMTEGKVLFIDDCTLISPAVLAVTYPAMDGRGEVKVKAHKGETITAAPGFYDGKLIPRPSFFQLDNIRKARRRGEPWHLIVHEDVLIFRNPLPGSARTQVFPGHNCGAGVPATACPVPGAPGGPRSAA